MAKVHRVEVLRRMVKDAYRAQELARGKTYQAKCKVELLLEAAISWKP